ncbi:MAG: hypothetical protein DCC71_17450, partial [Proteobacteria bacterium]
MSSDCSGARAWTRVLDPADASPETRRALRAWLALQRALAYEPARARRALAERGSPVAALRALFGARPEEL